MMGRKKYGEGLEWFMIRSILGSSVEHGGVSVMATHGLPMNGHCGEGFRSRNLTCVVHDTSTSGAKKQVDPKLCGPLPSEESPLNSNCYVPCPGDCHLSEWSHWSSCEVACIDGRSFETVGRQSRSRTFIVQALGNQENCPKPVIDTRPCTGGKCFRYTWRMSPWRDNKRTVWCQRSDGMNITGGCAPNSQPAAVRNCDPPCRKPFSYCMQVTYLERTSLHNHLNSTHKYKTEVVVYLERT
ncbi:thrombospondin type-1 domain-containing protein 7B-like [Mixophyes fleayi]|uniref:thrombospondin type-1 domain-containing protein 7B-like n=1 Tax=Mixophyes fleayi TaxID=3061075 RepID=UPI003F4DD2D3